MGCAQGGRDTRRHPRGMALGLVRAAVKSEARRGKGGAEAYACCRGAELAQWREWQEAPACDTLGVCTVELYLFYASCA